MAFRVTSVIDGDTFDVQPGWRTDGRSGHRVRIASFDAPELHARGGQAARSRLETLIGGKSVELYTKAIDRYGRLVADVRLNRIDITAFLN